MSYTYSLVCLESREILSVGKIVSINEEGATIPAEFGSWIDQDTGRRIARDDLMELVMVFLIHNRCREIRLLPDQWIQQCDPEGKLRYFDSMDEYLAERRFLKENEELDAREVPTEISEAFSRAIKGRD